MHARTVLTFDNRPLAADRLNGVEAAIPDRHTRQGKCAHQIAFHVQEKLFSDDHGDKGRNQCSHGQHFPVIFIDEHAQHLSQINADLCKAPAMPQPITMSPPSFGVYFSHSAPPHIFQ